MSDYYESEIEPITGIDFEQKNKSKVKKIKMKCNSCGHIDFCLTCDKCGGSMFKFKNHFK